MKFNRNNLESNGPPLLSSSPPPLLSKQAKVSLYITGYIYNYLHVNARATTLVFRVSSSLRAIEFIATVIHLSTGSPPLAARVRLS